jgi:hypothetical protein
VPSNISSFFETSLHTPYNIASVALIPYAMVMHAPVKTSSNFVWAYF